MNNSEKKFKEDIEYRIYRIKHLAKKHGWKLISQHGSDLNFNLIWYGNTFTTIKINYISFDIETSLIHPKRGRTNLKRTGNFTMTLIEKIFTNPRMHMPAQINSLYG